MELRALELQLIEINESIIRRYSNTRNIKSFNHRQETHHDYIKLDHLKEKSLERVKTVDEKLQSHPYFLKSKTIRDEVGKELYIKGEYSDKWNTYQDTNRLNLSKFLKDMLPYIDKATIKRLKHGKYFRSVVDGLLKNTELLDLAKTPNGYAVVSSKKTREFYTEPVVKDLNKKYSKEKLVKLTKDEEWINEVLEEKETSSKQDNNKCKKKAICSSRAKLFNTNPHLYKYTELY